MEEQRIGGEDTKWKINMVGFNRFSKEIEDQVWLDPSVKIDELLHELRNLSFLKIHFHPYDQWYNRNKTSGNNFFNSQYYNADQKIHEITLRSEEVDSNAMISPPECLSEIKRLSQYFFEYDNKGKVYVGVQKDMLSDNALFMFNPNDDEAKIISAIKRVRRNILKKIKNRTGIKEKCSLREFNSGKINRYIGWFKKYDEIIAYCKDNEKTEKPMLKEENGAMVVYGDFKFSDVVPEDTKGEKFYSQEKAYKDAYEGAVQLIQNTPNIKFSAKRIQN